MVSVSSNIEGEVEERGSREHGCGSGNNVFRVSRLLF